MSAQELNPPETRLADEVSSQGPVPRLIQFSGQLKDHLGQPLSGIQGVTFGIYKEQQGGSPLWMETQNVVADDEGRYAVLLGATTGEGVPLDLFASGESRWLGVQVNLAGELDQPRVLLVSVPYALKAADAETLGGKPLSAFVLASEQVTARVQKSGGLAGKEMSDGIPTAAISGTGTTNKVAKWTDGTNGVLGDSSIFDNGNVGIGTMSPAQLLDVYKNQNAETGLYVQNNDTGTGAFARAQFRNAGTGNDAVSVGVFGTGWTTSGAFVQDGGYLISEAALTGGLSIGTRAAAANLRFYTGGVTNANERMRIISSGNVGIGTTDPTTKLDIRTGADATSGVAVRANSSSQSADLQQWQDSGGNTLASVNAAGTLVGPLGMMLANASFVQAAGTDSGTASFLPSDSVMEAQTGTTANSIDDTVGGVLDTSNLSRTGSLVEGLDRTGAFVSARARWTSGTINSNHQFYVLAGGAANSGSLPTNGAQSGFGFKAEGTALKGITISGGTATVVDLTTTLASGTFVELMAIRRSSSVQFYVNGVLKGSSSTDLPTSAASTYEVRTQNETSGTATNAAVQVGLLTVGIPRP